jgi:hypothetical protein
MMFAPKDVPHPLQSVFDAVIDQVANGKGAERHGGETPFLAQPWVHYAEQHGVGFLTGQAAKKLDESNRLSGEAIERELLGAIAYAAMALLYLRGRV